MKTRVKVAAALVAGIVAGGILWGVSRSTECVENKDGSYTAPPNSNGLLDDTAELEAFLACVPDNRVINFPTKDGPITYEVEQTFDITDRVGLTFQAAGVTFKASTLVGDLDPEDPKSNPRPHVHILRGMDIVIRGLTIDGANVTCDYIGEFAFEAGFMDTFSNGTVLDGVHVTEVGGDGVTLEGQGQHTGQPDLNASVLGSTFDCYGRMGVGVTDIDGFTITGNQFTRGGRSTIDLEPVDQDQTIQNGVIENNTRAQMTQPNSFAFLAAGNDDPKFNIVFRGNVAEGPVIVLFRGSNLTVENNIGNTGGGAPHDPTIKASGGTGLIVRGNTQPFDSKTPVFAIKLTNWCEASVTDNDFTGATGVYEGTPNPGCAWAESGNTL
jgi:hypothetical protein